MIHPRPLALIAEVSVLHYLGFNILTFDGTRFESTASSTPSIVLSERSKEQGSAASHVSETREQKKSANSASATKDRPDLRVETDQVQTLPPQSPLSNINSSPREGAEEGSWAVRPRPEEIYEQLEKFFPDHDLDKPVIDAAAEPKQTRRRSIHHVTKESRTSSTFGTDGASELQHSIRQVAKERRTTGTLNTDDTSQSAGSSSELSFNSFLCVRFNGHP